MKYVWTRQRITQSSTEGIRLGGNRSVEYRGDNETEESLSHEWHKAGSASASSLLAVINTGCLESIRQRNYSFFSAISNRGGRWEGLVYAGRMGWIVYPSILNWEL